MIDLFSLKRDGALEIAKDNDDLLARMGRAIVHRQPALDALDQHDEVDVALVERIEEILKPSLGRSDGSDAVWFQSMDWYGDGIRHLEFQPNRFPPDAIGPSQALLTGDHANFGILCWTPLKEGGSDGLVIFNDRLILTEGIARALSAV